MIALLPICSDEQVVLAMPSKILLELEIVDQFGGFGANERETFDEATTCSRYLIALLDLAKFEQLLVALPSFGACCSSGSSQWHFRVAQMEYLVLLLPLFRHIEALRPRHSLRVAESATAG